MKAECGECCSHACVAKIFVVGCIQFCDQKYSLKSKVSAVRVQIFMIKIIIFEQMLLSI